MADWIDRLSKEEAQAILDTPNKSRFEGRDGRGEKTTLYARPTKGQMDRIRAKAETPGNDLGIPKE